MIISKTPLRMSFLGGGSDFSVFYRKNKGAVLTTAIDKYIYININQKFDSGIRVAYSKNEEVNSIDEIEHCLVREALRFYELHGGIEITTIADIPSKGTGLGSSSSFTVGLIHALNAFEGKSLSSQELSEDSCKIEIGICQEPIGKQDQYIASYGGFKLIEFNPDESVVITPVQCFSSTLKKIENNILLFYTGITRSASEILIKQSIEVGSNKAKQDTLKKMVDLAYISFNEIQSNNTDNFGKILNEGWRLKKSITSEISSADIDYWYDLAIRAGAEGGKILGAGAGGFLMLYAPIEKHESIKLALHSLKYVPVSFEPFGSRIIFNN